MGRLQICGRLDQFTQPAGRNQETPSQTHGLDSHLLRRQYLARIEHRPDRGGETAALLWPENNCAVERWGYPEALETALHRYPRFMILLRTQ